MDLLKFALILNFTIIMVLPVPVYIEILKSRNIGNVILSHCNRNIIESQKNLIANNIRSVFLANSTDLSNLSYAKVGFILDTHCESWNQIFNVVDERFFRGPFTWLVNTDDLNSTVDVLSKYPIDINSDFIVITKNRKVFNLYEVYSKGFYTNGSFIVRDLGHFDSELHLKRNIRADLTGVVLKCVVVIVDPIVNETFEHYLENTSPGKLIDSVHKLKFFRLMKYLQNIYNFSLMLQRTNSWGYLRNGSFDGLVGSLQRRDADIGGSSIFYRSDRLKIIDYVTSTWQTRHCFILRHPKYPGGFYTIYTGPLTDIVWYWILFVLTLAGLVTCIMLKIRAIKRPGDDEDSSSSMALIFIFSAISQQGTTLNRGSISIKIVTFVTFIFTLTLYQYYNATVVSTLLREPPKTIRNLKDLLESNLKVGVEDVLYNKDHFRRTTDAVTLELYHKKIVTGKEYNFFKPDHGMRLVKAGGFAYHIDSIIGYRIMRNTFTEREICDAHEIYLYPPQKMAVTLQKNSPYREHVVIGIQKIYESGLMYRLKSVWDEPKPQCVHTPDSSVFSVSLREFSSVLIMLALGMVLSVSILFLEIIVGRYKVKVYDFCH
uniref:Ionotropic receptor 64a n=1 Tax=Heliconius melpomene rosina TaxID=171916 RepID=A0A140G9G6_HELME|nr:ionotropic receptor 64a [Heliconius melpomene rosina]